MANVNKTPGKARRAEVAGGGFAGLTAAIALRQNGWDVRLHEKSSELRAFGAGIYLWHNGLRVLEGLGALDDVLQGSHTPPTYETWMHNKSVSKETFNGLPWRIMTRSHLHDALVKRARAVGVDIRANSEAVAADPQGRLTLQTGEVLEADLIVGADGVGSKVRDSIGFKQDRWVSKDGLIRLIVPRKKKELGHGEWDNTIDMWNFWPRVQRILYSPCNENELYLGLMAPAADPRGSAVPIDLEVWVEMFPFLEPCLIEAAKLKTARYDKYETTKLDSWTRGKVALVETPRMQCARLLPRAPVARWSMPSACRKTWRQAPPSKTRSSIGRNAFARPPIAARPFQATMRRTARSRRGTCSRRQPWKQPATTRCAASIRGRSRT